MKMIEPPNDVLDLVITEPTTGCWLWGGRLQTDGYGMFSSDSQSYAAHRYVYELLKGKIPYSWVIDHVCEMRCCVNPDHLKAVTVEVNARRGRHCRPWRTWKTLNENGQYRKPYRPIVRGDIFEMLPDAGVQWFSQLSSCRHLRQAA
jgi:hypothetical protein